MADSLHQAVTLGYYETTAARSHAASKEYYDSSADGMFRWLGPWLPVDQQAECLDLACGCGEMQYLLERQGFANTTGVDLCKDELDLARKFLKGGLVNDDILRYLQGCSSGSIEFISALNILEHLRKEILHQVLVEVRRVLKPGGTLVAIVPNAVSPFGALTRHWDITHEWAFTTNNFRQLSTLIGFEEAVEFRECGPVAHGPVSFVRSLLWQCIRAIIAIRFLIEIGSLKDGIYTMDMMVRLRKPE